MSKSSTYILILVAIAVILILGLFGLIPSSFTAAMNIAVALILVVATFSLRDSTDKLGNFTSELVKATNRLAKIQIAPRLDWYNLQQPRETHQFLRFSLINKGTDLAEVASYSAKLVKENMPTEIYPHPRDRGMILKPDEPIYFDLTAISEGNYVSGIFVDLKIEYVDKEKNTYPAFEKRIKVE